MNLNKTTRVAGKVNGINASYRPNTGEVTIEGASASDENVLLLATLLRAGGKEVTRESMFPLFSAGNGSYETHPLGQGIQDGALSVLLDNINRVEAETPIADKIIKGEADSSGNLVLTADMFAMNDLDAPAPASDLESVAAYFPYFIIEITNSNLNKVLDNNVGLDLTYSGIRVLNHKPFASSSKRNCTLSTGDSVSKSRFMIVPYMTVANKPYVIQGMLEVVPAEISTDNAEVTKNLVASFTNLAEGDKVSLIIPGTTHATYQELQTIL